MLGTDRSDHERGFEWSCEIEIVFIVMMMIMMVIDDDVGLYFSFGTHTGKIIRVPKSYCK